MQGCFSQAVVGQGRMIQARCKVILENSLPSALPLSTHLYWCFQEDSAPCHTARMFKVWMKHILYVPQPHLICTKTYDTVQINDDAAGTQVPLPQENWRPYCDPMWHEKEEDSMQGFLYFFIELQI